MKYLVALPIQPMAVGESYESIPAHCTIMHWFEINSASGPRFVAGPIHRALALAGAKAPKDGVKVGLGSMIALGREHVKPCYSVNYDEGLYQLHTDLLIGLAGIVSFQHPEWIGARYNPHVSKKPYPLAVGQIYQVRDLLLIECDSSGLRTVIQSHPLGEDSS